MSIVDMFSVIYFQMLLHLIVDYDDLIPPHMSFSEFFKVQVKIMNAPSLCIQYMKSSTMYYTVNNRLF